MNSITTDRVTLDIRSRGGDYDTWVERCAICVVFSGTSVMIERTWDSQNMDMALSRGVTGAR